MDNENNPTSDPSPAAASPSPLSTEGVVQAQTGETTDQAKNAADKVATQHAALDEQYRATAEEGQRAFLAELIKRERAAVQAFAAFLEALPGTLDLGGVAEAARVAAVEAAASLDTVLGAGEQMMGAGNAG